MLEFFTEPEPFTATAGAALAADPVVSTVLATVTARAIDDASAGITPPPGVPRWWLAVREGARVVGTGMRTATGPPYPLYLLPMPQTAAVRLAQVLHERGEPAPAANGALPAVEQYAVAAARLTGGSAEVQLRSRLFELAELIPAPAVPGELRPAGIGDLELIADWWQAFQPAADAQSGRPPTPVAEVATAESLTRRIRAGRIWLWTIEGQPVCLVGAAGPSFGVSRVGPVYTPADQRGRGYASAATAAVSAILLAEGRVCLFTDTANPVTNRLYPALGYRPLVDMANLVIG